MGAVSLHYGLALPPRHKKLQTESTFIVSLGLPSGCSEYWVCPSNNYQCLALGVGAGLAFSSWPTKLGVFLSTGKMKIQCLLQETGKDSE